MVAVQAYEKASHRYPWPPEEDGLDPSSRIPEEALRSQSGFAIMKTLVGSLPLAGVSPLAMAKRLKCQSEIRAEHFPERMFQAPAWEMLLAVYIADEDSAEIDLGEVCVAARLTRSTGVRLVARLEDDGLVAREAAVARGRARLVRLTQEGRSRPTSYLVAMI